jgi:polyisoprenoid-binding protein YceI
MFTRRAFLACLAATASPALARAQQYRLDAQSSRVGFTYRLSGALQQGEMPITRAELDIDPQNLAASTARVTVNAAGARTAFFFATDALKSAQVLDTERFPDITFVSTAVELAPSGRLSDGAALIGDLTLRGITRPVRLKADLFRAPGSAPDDLSLLTIRLRGTLSRAAFGATGFADLVADEVSLDITAVIRAVD